MLIPNDDRVIHNVDIFVGPVTESREYGNPIPSQNASLSNNYNITSAVHNCMWCVSIRVRTLRAHFMHRRYADTIL